MLIQYLTALLGFAGAGVGAVFIIAVMNAVDAEERDLLER